MFMQTCSDIVLRKASDNSGHKIVVCKVAGKEVLPLVRGDMVGDGFFEVRHNGKKDVKG